MPCHWLKPTSEKKLRSRSWVFSSKSCGVLTGKQATRAACAAATTSRLRCVTDHSAISAWSLAALLVRTTRSPQMPASLVHSGLPITSHQRRH